MSEEKAQIINENGGRLKSVLWFVSDPGKISNPRWFMENELKQEMAARPQTPTGNGKSYVTASSK